MSKKITLIYPFAYGYFDFVIQELQSNPNVLVTDIKTELIKYHYPNLFAKIKNGIKKIFGSNIKTEYFQQEILKQIKEKQDIIFIIRPDLMEDSFLLELKKQSKKFIAYYYDSCKKLPRQIDLIPLFDEVFSYEKNDIEKYHFKTTHNFIYDENIEQVALKYDIYNVSSYDSRINELEKISDDFVNAGFKIYFLLFWFKKLQFPNLISTTEYLNLEDSKKLIAQSKSMLDLQRNDQNGLSFRVFESLGYRKKLLTTNSAVKDFDFFHPNNILIIDPEKLNVSEVRQFLEIPYTEIADEILEKYRVNTFVKNIFKP